MSIVQSLKTLNNQKRFVTIKIDKRKTKSWNSCFSNQKWKTTHKLYNDLSYGKWFIYLFIKIPSEQLDIIYRKINEISSV